MFHRIQEFGLVYAGGRVFRPRLYGDPQADQSWAGWLIFFPVPAGVAIAPPSPETTQATLTALQAWGTGLTVVYLEGALDRALRVAEHSPILVHLVDAEYQALDDAARLESAAHIERMAADVDEAAADAARVDAERIRRERLDAESAVAALDERSATANAKHRRRSAQARADRGRRQTVKKR